MYLNCLVVDLAKLFKPLGGQYSDEYWPLTEAQLIELEAALGWALPAEFRSFVARFGLSQSIGSLAVRRDDGLEVPTVGVMFGHFEQNPLYSLLHPRCLRPSGGLLFANSDQGMFELRQDGSIFFESNGAPMDAPDQDAVIAASFSDFLERLYALPE